MSRFEDEAQQWWELITREIGTNQNGDQVYPDYTVFKQEVRNRFWKYSNAKIKYAQWEKLHQVNFPDSDLFFQQFEALVFDARILGNNRMMMVQVKKVCRETSKNTIYTGDGMIPATYPQWKSHLLCIDYNWRLKKAEGTAGQRLADAKTQTQKAAMLICRLHVHT